MAWLRVKQGFDYRWPSRSVTRFEARTEPYQVKREVIEFAVGKGYGDEFNAARTKARSAGAMAGRDSGEDGAGSGDVADAADSVVDDSAEDGVPVSTGG